MRCTEIKTRRMLFFEDLRQNNSAATFFVVLQRTVSTIHISHNLNAAYIGTFESDYYCYSF